MEPFSTPGDRHITMTFNNQEEVSFGLENGMPRFLPDIATCVRYLFDFAIFHQHGDFTNNFPNYQNGKTTLTLDLDKFEIVFNRAECQFYTTWDGENPPAEFLAFQQEFN